MEIKFLTKVLEDYGIWGAIALIFLYGLWKIINKVIDKVSITINKFHEDAMTKMDENNDKLADKLDSVVKKLSEMDKNMERHAVELEHGAREFTDLKEHNKIQDEKIHNLKNEIQGVALKVHSIKGSIVPVETVQALIEASKSV